MTKMETFRHVVFWWGVTLFIGAIVVVLISYWPTLQVVSTP